MFEVFRRNAAATVLHPHTHDGKAGITTRTAAGRPHTAVAVRRKHDAPARGRVAQCVVQQIGDRTLDQLHIHLRGKRFAGVAAAAFEVAFDFASQRHALARRALGKAQHDVVQHFGQVQPRQAQAKARFVQHREVAERTYEARGVVRIAQRHLHEHHFFFAAGGVDGGARCCAAAFGIGLTGTPALLQRLQARGGGGER